MAAGSTYTPLATTTLSSSQSTVTFSSISGSYTDLILISAVAGLNSGGSAYSIQLNGDTSTNYSSTSILGNGSTATSARLSNSSVMQIGANDNGSGTGVETLVTHFMNYSNTSTNKTVLSRWAAGAVGTTAAVGLWRNTAAITSILIQTNGSKTFNSGSTFTLYGIQAA